MDVTHSIKCEVPGESLLRSGILRLKVNGWSMIPTIWPGDVLIIRSLNQEGVQPGHIALYRREGRLFVHRVLAYDASRRDQLVVARGDSMPEADPPVPGRDLLAKLDFILRKGKKIAPANRIPLPHRAVAALIQNSKLGARAVFGFRHRHHRVADFDGATAR